MVEDRKIFIRMTTSLNGAIHFLIEKPLLSIGVIMSVQNFYIPHGHSFISVTLYY